MAWRRLSKPDVISVLEREGKHLTRSQKRSRNLLNEEINRSGDGVIQALNDLAHQRGLEHGFLDIATEKEKLLSVKGGVCGCCGREVGAGAWTEVQFVEVPNVHQLQPSEVHDGMRLTLGLLLNEAALREGDDGHRIVGCVMSVLDR
ncbi:uncharacterized protein EI90DRAFT_3015844 [Cantharellus anzutake]|uniref:uncharacterized protein n=1 Tax=Cantharellus anzutake TaxID=1750568 RepID=UPI001906D93B|nr:uncharacterized protein EI90DRAFT_3015844 [Cantharellus anzutake]KAF8332838.1 hypothetical protein EI90DRAFT_3015844 [Cantharellus anzutake]